MASSSGLDPTGYGPSRRGSSEPTEELPRRLATMHAEITSLIEEFAPSVLAIERVLFQVNVSTAMAVGHASGVVMAAGATAGCDVIQYSPNEIKLAVTGYGAADKQQVERMVRAQLKIEHELKPVDAADAIAVALCHTAIVGIPPVEVRGPRASVPGVAGLSS